MSLFRNRVIWPIVLFVGLLILAFASRCRAESELWIDCSNAGQTDVNKGLDMMLVGRQL